MSKKSYLNCGAALVACVCVALVVLAILPPPGTRSAVTKMNFDRIEPGMTVPEVKAILGPETVLSSFKRDDEEYHTWMNPDDGSIADLAFSDGKLDEAKWTPSRHTLADKLRRWLRLPK